MPKHSSGQIVSAFKDRFPKIPVYVRTEPKTDQTSVVAVHNVCHLYRMVILNSLWVFLFTSTRSFTVIIIVICGVFK